MLFFFLKRRARRAALLQKMCVCIHKSDFFYLFAYSSCLIRQMIRFIYSCDLDLSLFDIYEIVSQ